MQYKLKCVKNRAGDTTGLNVGGHFASCFVYEIVVWIQSWNWCDWFSAMFHYEKKLVCMNCMAIH